MKQRIKLTIKRNAKSYLRIQIYVYILVLWVVLKKWKKNGKNEMQYKKRFTKYILYFYWTTGKKGKF